MLEKKYYDGMQIHDVLCECLDDYDTILTILEKFASLPSAINADRKTKPQSEYCPTCGQMYPKWIREQTEPQTDCETCRHAGECDWEPWQECPYAPKDEPQQVTGKLQASKDEPQTDCADTNLSEKPTDSTRSKMEQVDKDINVRGKTEPQQVTGKLADTVIPTDIERGVWDYKGKGKWEKTEPQTERSE